MEFSGITTIWVDSPKDIRGEFTTEFNRMVDDEGVSGVHLFYFSRYKDYTIYTEQMVAHIYEDTVIFYLYCGSMMIQLDESMQIVTGDIVPSNHLVLSALHDENPIIDNIGWVCTPEGHSFEAYSLKFEKPLQRAYEMFDNEHYSLAGLDVLETELIDVSLMYLNQKIETWSEEINNSVEADHASATIDDNPFANKFYDREEAYQMRDDKMRIGDRKV